MMIIQPLVVDLLKPRRNLLSWKTSLVNKKTRTNVTPSVIILTPTRCNMASVDLTVPDTIFEAEDVMWLKDLPYTITLPDLGFIVVHAGLVPGRSLREQDLNDMCNMRSLLRTANGGFSASPKGDNNGRMPWAEHW